MPSDDMTARLKAIAEHREEAISRIMRSDYDSFKFTSNKCQKFVLEDVPFLLSLVAEQQREIERLIADAGEGGHAANAPKELWLVSTMPGSCDSWLHVGRVYTEDGKLTPFMQEKVDVGAVSAPVKYIRWDAAGSPAGAASQSERVG